MEVGGASVAFLLPSSDHDGKEKKDAATVSSVAAGDTAGDMMGEQRAEEGQKHTAMLFMFDAIVVSVRAALLAIGASIIRALSWR